MSVDQLAISLTRVCSDCHLDKPISDFTFHFIKLLDGKRRREADTYCRECKKLREPELARQRVKEYNARPEVKRRKKQWEQENTPYELRKPYFQQYYQNNIEEFRAFRRTQQLIEPKQGRSQRPPAVRLRRNVSQAILETLKKNGSNKKGESSFKHLPYKIGELVDYLEAQFDANMTWENYGSYWQLDHIIPQSDLPYSSMTEENFDICWSLDNLRPLEARQNLMDGINRTRHKKPR